MARQNLARSPRGEYTMVTKTYWGMMRKLSWMLLLLLTVSLWAVEGDEAENQEPVLGGEDSLGEEWIGDGAEIFVPLY